MKLVFIAFTPLLKKFVNQGIIWLTMLLGAKITKHKYIRNVDKIDLTKIDCLIVLSHYAPLNYIFF